MHANIHTTLSLVPRQTDDGAWEDLLASSISGRSWNQAMPHRAMVEYHISHEVLLAKNMQIERTCTLIGCHSQIV